VDGELDLTKHLEIDQHLQACSACAQAYANLQAVRTAIKDGAPYFQAPSDLQKHLRSLVLGAKEVKAPLVPFSRLWLAVAASLALGMLAGWGMARVLSERVADASLAQAVIDIHLRSLQLPGHLVDKESSNQHVVKPWFEGKVNFSPPVPDLTDKDFPLVGGRLDYLDNRTIATLIYRRRQHDINLFIWPSTKGAEAAMKEVTRQGYYLFHWTQTGMTYWAVSNLNESELREFVQLIQARTQAQTSTNPAKANGKP
jgi:anti-sigma factor RsiW